MWFVVQEGNPLTYLFLCSPLKRVAVLIPPSKAIPIFDKILLFDERFVGQ